MNPQRRWGGDASDALFHLETAEGFPNQVRRYLIIDALAIDYVECFTTFTEEALQRLLSCS